MRALATTGEYAMGLMWAAVAVSLLFAVAGRALCETARGRARRWFDQRFAVRYRTPPEVTQMATGFWWSGHEYHRSETEARRRARQSARSGDPQVRRDALWLAAASITLLPATAAPPAAIVAGVLLAAAGGNAAAAAVLVLAGSAAAPFAWRALRPVASRFLGPDPRAELGERVEELEAVRANLTAAQAAELERIERGLHDGAQARLVALGISMGAAERLLESDPAAARAMLAEARVSSASALDELRSLVRGINPPVLAERGLVDAVRALALDIPVKASVHAVVPSRPERPVEAAVYYAAAELLANVVKHAHAAHVTITIGYSMSERRLTLAVLDDGIGGARIGHGSGLAGIAQRMRAFDGTIEVASPPGGPTRVTVVVPCALS